MRTPHKAALLRLALTQRPDARPLYDQLGTLLLEEGPFEEAAQCFRRSLQLEPGRPDALRGLGEAHFKAANALAKTDRSSEAVTLLESALAANPEHYNAMHLLTRLLLATGDTDTALAVCERSLQQVPGNSAALATKTLVLLERGDRDEAQQLLDFDRFIRVVEPTLPAAYADRPAFLAALESALKANPALEFEPAGRTARGGLRADLAVIEDTPESAVYEMVDAATRQYVEGLQGGRHPFVDAVPARASLTLWGNVLQTGGYHTAHVHPAAWLSGVFYVKVPPGGAAAAGQLQLGCDEHLLRGSVPPLVHYICPKAGSLVLFPSYFYHRTLPTSGTGERISIAFDMVPMA